MGHDGVGREEPAERLPAYGLRIARLGRSLPGNHALLHIGDQRHGSGTAAGAHYEETQGAEPRNGFIHKPQTALKQLRESRYWLRLFAQAEAAGVARLDTAADEAPQCRAILSKCVAAAKGKRPCST